MITVSKDKYRLQTATWKMLRAINFDFKATFQLPLADGTLLFAEEIIRIMPTRRLVVYGTWQGKEVVAKLFFSPDHARRHYEKEVAGIKLLMQANIPTPPLYYHGKSANPLIYVILAKRIAPSKTMATIWQNKQNITSLAPILRQLLIELATQHVLGIVHGDLHLNNFLMTKKIIYTLDGAEIEPHPYLLPKKLSVKHVALLIAQFGAISKTQQATLFRYYTKARGWTIKQEDLNELYFLIRQAQEKRWQQYSQKIKRSCSQFLRKKTSQQLMIADRSYLGPDLHQFLDQPELIFNDTQAIILKAGRSATVIKIKLDNKWFVIKRYNIKNVWHHLRRALRATRAARAWEISQKLSLFGIATAAPVAFVEKRWMGLRGESYFVTEFVSDQHAGHFLNQHTVDDPAVIDLIKQIAVLLKSVKQIELTHGDLKITNILLNSHQQPVLIDLDGAKEHGSAVSLRAAWRKDIRRFLKNFHTYPQLIEKFKRALMSA